MSDGPGGRWWGGIIGTVLVLVGMWLAHNVGYQRGEAKGPGARAPSKASEYVRIAGQQWSREAFEALKAANERAWRREIEDAQDRAVAIRVCLECHKGKEEPHPRVLPEAVERMRRLYAPRGTVAWTSDDPIYVPDGNGVAP